MNAACKSLDHTPGAGIVRTVPVRSWLASVLLFAFVFAFVFVFVFVSAPVIVAALVTRERNRVHDRRRGRSKLVQPNQQHDPRT